MSSIFSTQNLQTFLRRKNLRPPGPPSRGPPPPGPRPGPPNLGRSPPGLPPSLRGLSLDAACSGAFVSSPITLLNQWPVISSQWPARKSLVQSGNWSLTTGHRPLASYALAGVSAVGAAALSSATAAGCALTFFFASR